MTDSTALVIHPDGQIDDLNLDPDDGQNLARFYAALDCTRVDVVRMTSRIDMWLDDEGFLTGRAFNRAATALARSFGWSHQPYVGPVLLAGVDNDGGSINLTAYQVRAVATRIQDLLDAGII